MMVFLLAHDIAYYHIFVTQTIAEPSILTAPTSKMREQGVAFHSFTCTRLHSLHKFCNRHGRWQRNKDMHMVWHTAYAISLAVEILGNTIDISIKVTFMFNGYSRLTPICPKYNVII